MKRVLLIAGVLVLLLGTVALWLSIEPPPEPPNGRPTAATGASSSQQESSANKTETGSDTDKARPQPTQSTLSEPPESEENSGFRPITKIQSDPDRPKGEAAKSSFEGSAPNSGGEEQVSSGATPDGPFREPSTLASGGGMGDTRVVPPRPNQGPAVQRPHRKPEPTANTIEPPSNRSTPTPEPLEPATIAGKQLETKQPPSEPVRVPGTVTSNKRPRPHRRQRRPPAPPGRYETITTATARAQPNDTGPIVDRIRRGTILNVTGSDGNWLVVYSKKKNITVYVNRAEAMLSQGPPPLSKEVPESKWPDVERAIQQAFVRNNVVGIQATFIGNTAYLKGTVKSDLERERAEIFARSVLEVKHVFNGIRVE